MAGLLILGLLACARLVLPTTLLLTEMCYHPLDLGNYLEEEFNNGSLKIMPPEEICGDPQKLLQSISISSDPMVGSLPPSLCLPAHLLAEFHHKELNTWNCPQEAVESRRNSLSASVFFIAKSFAQLVASMKWKSIAIISSKSKWWPGLAQSLDAQLREIGIIPRHSFLINEDSSKHQIERKLRILRRTFCRVAIICAPANNFGKTILHVLDELELAKDHNTLSVLMDVGDFPSWVYSINEAPRIKEYLEENAIKIKIDNITNKNVTENVDSTTNSTQTLKEVKEEKINVDYKQDLNLNKLIDNERKENDKNKSLINYSALSNYIVDDVNVSFIDRISFTTKKYALIFTESHQESDDLKMGFNKTIDNTVINHIQEYFAHDYPIDHEFVLLDLKEDDSFRCLLSVKKNNFSEIVVNKIAVNLEEWVLKHKDEECDNCENELTKMLSGVVILGLSCLLVAIVFGAAAFARYQLLKKRVTKGPYKVLLTATDFVFPQIPDSRRVDEGIEAMLCCWLQQLQEFGGPEVEKPDLLQGSGNARTPLRGGSSPSLAKQLIVDPRVRYNGDLVQMKAIPYAGSGMELKAKTVELLVLLHGLRHENLNPLIGCLAEPPKAALVSEWCARGSLQDVLQQDDIKLDWSFRLSLLTDLVRGMKYLHSTPIRVHGYLTSRNCVIDARWVLKVTDYGLPAFYDAQGITPPQKSARDLLWTSPELLRHANNRKKGTQPGDVYSFGIIMQEVVVRGEPFCMLALTPEEIIEKVKRPPPLIRPSVSKGAAPPEAINIMRQCWAEQGEMRPDFNTVHDQFKKLNHGRKVNIVDTMFQMLEKYSNNLEELIRERTEQLDIEKKKTEQLLNRMLPSSVADKLKLGMPVDPEAFSEVTIYFSDIVGFTTISAHSTPFQVVDLLNDLYTCFDATINAYNVYKVETIGDAYMVVGGLPVRVPDHAEQIAQMALDLLHQSGRFRIQHLPGTPLRLRIGLHSGPCCAGVVGLTMPRYCLFGDTVNTASRMESTGAAWRIHMSQETKELLEQAGGYQIEERGPIDIKGKGTMNTYWLLGKEGFNKPLPVPPSIEESHGMDESLIICKSISNTYFADEGSSGTRTSPEPQPQPPSRSELQEVLHVQEQPAAAPPHSQPARPTAIPDPTFMKTMEHSKFSSLTAAGSDSIHKHDFHMVKSTSSDTPMSLGTPVSASEVAAALLGASTSSLCGFRGRHRRIEEEDLSTPYNHYKCLSPKERSGKLLRRQFSLDRTEEILNESLSLMTPRLYKQNSAGAADLEKIEEAPISILSPSASNVTHLHGSLSISVDSLIH